MKCGRQKHFGRKQSFSERLIQAAEGTASVAQQPTGDNTKCL